MLSCQITNIQIAILEFGVSNQEAPMNVVQTIHIIYRKSKVIAILDNNEKKKFIADAIKYSPAIIPRK